MQLCSVKSCGFSGSGRFAKYDGAPTTAIHMSGPMRTAIMSFATCSPRSHARVIALGNDVGQAIVDDDLDLDVGILRQKFRKFRQEDRVGRIVDRRDPNRAGGLLPKLA